MSKGFALIKDLYTGGVAGSTGGVLCGGAAMLLRWLCGKTLAFVFCVFFAILTLLGAMNITIPSIIRAIANRPKDDYVEEDDEDYIDPATAVVNNIASKQIARKRQRREQQRARENAPEETPPETPQQLPPEKQPHPAPKQKKNHAPAPQDEVKQVPGKGAAFMERIDGDINAPLSGTAVSVTSYWPLAAPAGTCRRPPTVFRCPASSATSCAISTESGLPPVCSNVTETACAPGLASETKTGYAPFSETETASSSKKALT